MKESLQKLTPRMVVIIGLILIVFVLVALALILGIYLNYISQSRRDDPQEKLNTFVISNYEIKLEDKYDFKNPTRSLIDFTSNDYICLGNPTQKVAMKYWGECEYAEININTPVESTLTISSSPKIVENLRFKAINYPHYYVKTEAEEIELENKFAKKIEFTTEYYGDPTSMQIKYIYGCIEEDLCIFLDPREKNAKENVNFISTFVKNFEYRKIERKDKLDLVNLNQSGETEYVINKFNQKDISKWEVVKNLKGNFKFKIPANLKSMVETDKNGCVNINIENIKIIIAPDIYDDEFRLTCFPTFERAVCTSPKDIDFYGTYINIEQRQHLIPEVKIACNSQDLMYFEATLDAEVELNGGNIGIAIFSEEVIIYDKYLENRDLILNILSTLD